MRAKAFVEGGGWSEASERIVWVKRVTIERKEKEREAQVLSQGSFKGYGEDMRNGYRERQRCSRDT